MSLHHIAKQLKLPLIFYLLLLSIKPVMSGILLLIVIDLLKKNLQGKKILTKRDESVNQDTKDDELDENNYGSGNN